MFDFLQRVRSKFFKKKKLEITNHYKRFMYYKGEGIYFKEVLDIGAFEGQWSSMFKNIFPKANIIMIEANKSKSQLLKKQGAFYTELLGSEDGKKVKYYTCQDKGLETGNSIYKENSKFIFNYEERITKKLDTLISPRKIDLIKMDVQGSELDIIKGGLSLIANTKYMLLELQTTNYNFDSPRSEAVISYLQSLNFELIDIFELIYKKNCLIQFDAFFKNKIL